MQELHTVKKRWGHEVILHNSEKYCAKLLVFEKEMAGSMHYHLLKQETWYVNKGAFMYSWIDKAGVAYHREIVVGDIVTIPPGQPHQLKALEDSEIFESSTQHFDDDTYRIWR